MCRSDKSQPSRKCTWSVFKRIALIIVAVTVFVCGLFALAGRWDWMQGWAYLAVLIIGSAANDGILWRKNPDLLRRRGRFGKGTKTWDKVILVIFGLTSVMVMIVGALDSGRYHWSEMTLWLWPLGAALYITGQAIVTWCMVVNPFFEKTVRIQEDQNHKVIDTGPYRIVRHPGYTAIILGLVLGSPLMLGSWWAFIPAILTAIGLVVRTTLEDRVLQAELEGYREYAKRVPFRLVPYVW